MVLPEAVVHRFYEAFRPGNTDVLREVLAPDWIDHTLPPGRLPGLAGMQEALQRLQGLLPDLKTELIRMITDGNLVSAHLAFAGTHEGAFLGAPPSHNAIRFIAFDLHHVEGEHIAESWHLEDNLSLLMQIGVIPPLG